MKEEQRLYIERGRLEFIARTQGDRLDQQHELLVQRDAAIADLKKQNLALADRVAQQSELLSRAAEKEQEAARRLGYLFPRGLETPPPREDALSPSWCRVETDVPEFKPAFYCSVCDRIYEDASACPIHTVKCQVKRLGLICGKMAAFDATIEGETVPCCIDCSSGWIPQTKLLPLSGTEGFVAQPR